MNKKAIAILGAIFLLIVGTLGFLIYTKYGTKSSVTPPVSQGSNDAGSGANNNTPSSTAPTSAAAPVVQQNASPFVELISDQVVSPVLFFNGKGITYFDNQGNLYQASFQDNSTPLQIASKQSLDIEARAGIAKVLWPAKGDNFIAQFTTASGTDWSFYNSSAQSYTDLPPQVEALDWLPSGDQIYYIWLQNGKATLNISNPDTTNWKYIADMWETDDQISVSPDGKNILYYEQNSSGTANPINLTTPDGKVWKTLVRAGFNKGVLWSPDSQKFLFGKLDSASNQYQLWYYNLLTGETINLQATTTPDKAVWSNDSQTIYYAEPVSGVAGGNSLTSDKFYKLNIQTGDKQTYDPGSQVFDGRNLFLSSDETKLFFKNAQDGGLYYLNLNQ